MSTPLALLDLLDDARFHSGSELAHALGIARTTVWKHVRSLEQMGLDIYAVRGKGYRLAESLERLDARRLRAELRTGPCAAAPGVHVLDEVDSTSAWLAANAGRAPGGTVCLAERQLAGRGRRGRSWASPFGRNLYLSVLWRLPASRVPGLSIALGVAVAEACEAAGAPGLQLKWPNDLLAAGGKVGGILVDVSSGATGESTAIVGIGLNVDMPARLRAGIGQPVSDLNELAGRRLSRNALAGTLIRGAREALARHAAEGLEPFRARFAQRDASHGREVRVEQGGEVRTGRSLGIDAHGALLLETEEGLSRFHSGDVSLRAVP